MPIDDKGTIIIEGEGKLVGGQAHSRLNGTRTSEDYDSIEYKVGEVLKQAGHEWGQRFRYIIYAVPIKED